MAKVSVSLKGMKKASLYRKFEGKALRCTACKHYCIIAEGMTGICHTMGNIRGKLYSFVYGHPAAVNIDPIEKKPFFHLNPGSSFFSIGTYGCNFRCSFCQNWDLSQFPKEEANFSSQMASDLIRKRSGELSPEKAVELALQYGCDGIAYTYNEPVIWSEYAEDIAKLAHDKGLLNVFVSSGYETEEALDYLKHIDAYKIDLKGFREDFYTRNCGTKLSNVLDTIRSVWKRDKHLEIVTLVIPGENDDDEQLKGMADFIAGISPDVPWHVTQFHPDYKMMDKPITPVETLVKARDIGKKAGLRYVYIGNTPTENGENTYCPHCNALVVGREFYSINYFDIKDGNCGKCGKAIYGMWHKARITNL
ncbi:MAG: AmmeMemoRadiSam system radical SAM enzyme [Candidatus Micrarchaeota archaeon]|nr:AmmeMemoRadiSam system radical SAM enzyme [Candidatus Micrarchaeota archaeon]